MSTLEEIRTEQPMLNMNHNLVQTLSEKLDAVSRYDIYIQDATEQGCMACADLFRQIKQEDQRHIRLLRDEIKEHCQTDKWK
jgi:rubrerythrin